MQRRKIFAIVTGILLSASLARAQQPAADSVPEIAGLPPAARAAAASIDPEKIRAHVRFLSLDLLEGRGPGTRGGELAAQYIATQFALAGVEPAGENGTYFQPVPLFAVHDEAWGRRQSEDYVKHHYHQPSDEYRADWDFRGNAKLARFGFVLGWLASEQPQSVEWLAGDEFEPARKASQAQ
jgi:hypothetical protein